MNGSTNTLPSKKKVLQKIREHSRGLATVNFKMESILFIADEPFNERQVVNLGPPIGQMTFTQITYLVFSDDKPGYNWAHPCRYFLYNDSGDYLNTIQAGYSFSFYFPLNTFKMFDEPVPPPFEQYVFSHLLPAHIPFPPFPVYNGERYAVLFSGLTEYWHINDLEYMYRILIYIYGFNRENIFVLNFDGTCFPPKRLISWLPWCYRPPVPKYHTYSNEPLGATWPGDGTPYELRVNYSGTTENLLGVFDQLSKKLNPDDLLFIFTTNHGHLLNGVSQIDTYSSTTNTYFSPTDLAGALNNLPKFHKLVVVMEQCHSGGFMDYVLTSSKADSKCFIAACSKDKYSRQGLYFDVFANIWSKMITGYTSMLGLQPPKYSKCSVSDAAAKTASENYVTASGMALEDVPVMGVWPEDSSYEYIYLGLPPTS